MAVAVDRFGELLDSVEDDEHDRPNMPKTLSCQQPAHGPLNWSIQHSKELQDVVDTLSKGALYGLDFSVTVADPTLPDCPLIACSIGFTDLTGYTVHEIVGRNCRFLLNGVQPDFIDDQTRFQCRSFLQGSREGDNPERMNARVS
jgi:hypothetical protein